MPVIRTEVEVDAPPSRVWQVVSEPGNLSKWDKHIVAVRGVPPGGLQVGTTYTTDVRFMGVTAHVHATVLDLVPERSSKIRLSGLIEAVVETTLAPISAERTRLAQRVDYRFVGGPLGLLAAGAVRNLGAASVLHRGVVAQKLQAERGP